MRRKAMKPKRKAPTCYVIRCDRPEHRDGLCAAHWHRLKRTGSVMAFTPIGKPRGRGARKGRKAVAS